MVDSALTAPSDVKRKNPAKITQWREAQETAWTKLSPPVAADVQEDTTLADEDNVPTSEKANWRNNVEAAYKAVISFWNKADKPAPSMAVIATAIPYPRRKQKAEKNYTLASIGKAFAHARSAIRSETKAPSDLERLRNTPFQHRRGFALSRFANKQIEGLTFPEAPEPRGPDFELDMTDG